MPEARRRLGTAATVLSLCWYVPCLTAQVAAPSTAAQITPASATAAADGTLPKFDVISIKPNTSSDHPSMDYDPGNFNATGVSLKMMVLSFYDLKDDQLLGLPKWGDELRFDIQAKALDADPKALRALTGDQVRLLEQTILTDRFQLTFHHETKVLPVYELVVEKNGPKFQASKFAGDQRGANGMRAGSLHTNNRRGNADMTSTAVPIASLVNVLSRQVERVVVDKTGLMGRYDLNMTWSRDDGGTPASEQNAPALFTALVEQLGLRLRPTKSPQDVLVIDHVVVPAGN